METLDTFTEKREAWGMLFITKSEKFGIGLYLCIKDNHKSWFDKTRFVKLPRGNVLDWHSMKDDIILHSYIDSRAMRVALEDLEKELKKIDLMENKSRWE